MPKNLGKENSLEELGRQYGKKPNYMVAVVEFPPNGTSYLGGCPNAEYARCRRWEAQCDDLVPKAFPL